MGISEQELEELQQRPGVKAVRDSREEAQRFRLPQGGQGGPTPQHHDPNTIRITLDVEPKGQMRPRFFSAGKFQKTYKHEKQKAEESKLLGLLYQHAPQKPLECAVELKIVAYMPIPKSWPKWKRASAMEGSLRPDKKPDADNLTKMILDVFNGIFWRDDKQVVDISVKKYYSHSPRWEIEIGGLR